MFRSIFGYNYRVLRKYLNQNPVIYRVLRKYLNQNPVICE